MSTRISRLLVEARLYLYLLAGTLLLYPWVAALVLVYLAVTVWLSLQGNPPSISISVLFVILTVVSPLWLVSRRTNKQRIARENTEKELLDDHPTLREVAEQTAAELGKSPPRHVLFRLSPVFRHWGAPDDPDDREVSREIIRIDFSRTGVCSVFELRCDLAKAMLQPRMPHWLAARVMTQVDRIDTKLKGGPDPEFLPIHQRWLHKIRESEGNALRAWRLFSEMETDWALAGFYGKRCVASWIEKSWFAEWVFPMYRQVWLEPAWQRGFLPPTMEGFRRFHEETGADWLMDTDADRPVNLDSKHELGEIARWQPHRMRLLALDAAHDVAASVYDSRPAGLLLADSGAEERVVRREMEIETDETLERISWEDYPAKVILAEIDDAIHEQSELYDGKSLCDLPAIAAEYPELVYEMVTMPFLPESFEDRLATMPNALSGFLIRELLAKGWQMRFDLVHGVTLHHETLSSVLDPQEIAHSLADGSMSGEEFERLLNPARSDTPRQALGG